MSGIIIKAISHPTIINANPLRCGGAVEAEAINPKQKRNKMKNTSSLSDFMNNLIRFDTH